MSLMSKFGRAPLWRATVCGAVCCALSASATLSAQTIKPVFAWPAGASATMTSEMTAEGYPAEGAAAMPRKMVTSYQVSAHTEGLRITSQLIAMEPTMPNLATTGIDMNALTRRRSAFIVQKTGAFVRLDDTLTYKRFADSMTFNVAASMTARMNGRSSPVVDAMIARSQEQMRSALSVQNMTTTTKQQWDVQSVALTGRSWKVGDSATFADAPTPNPMLPSLRMMRYDGEVACPAGTVARCWQFTSRGSSSREQMREQLRAQTRAMMSTTMRSLPAPPGVDMEQMMTAMLDTMPVPEMVSITESIVDAATLLPLRVTATIRTSTGRASMPPTVARTVTTYAWKR